MALDNGPDSSWVRRRGVLPTIAREYRRIRARFPLEELAKYQGQWVAFSSDGCQIAAAADSLEDLEEQLAAAGQDPRQVVLEGLPGPEDAMPLGAEELS
jgi:hypothetical protein